MREYLVPDDNDLDCYQKEEIKNDLYSDSLDIIKWYSSLGFSDDEIDKALSGKKLITDNEHYEDLVLEVESLAHTYHTKGLEVEEVREVMSNI